MKRTLIPTFLFMAAFCWTPLSAGEDKSVAYEPAVVTLNGTIAKEGFSDDASPVDRGRTVWILHLNQPVSVPAKPGDEINTEEKNVTEVHLNIDPAKHPIPEDAFGKTHFVATGTLYHAHTTHHLRPIVMLVSTLTSAAPGAGHH